MRKIAKKPKNFRIWVFDQNFERFKDKLKIKAKYLMRNFDEESNLHENDFFGIRFGKQTFFFKFHDVFNKFWPKMNNLWKKEKKL